MVDAPRAEAESNGVRPLMLCRQKSGKLCNGVWALASRYRKIIGTELMVKATRMKPETSNDPQEIAISEAEDPEATEASVDRG